MESVSPDVTSLLKRLAGGHQDAASELIPVIYRELDSLAARHLCHERPDHTLQPTALVNEAYIKLVAQRSHWQSRAHFFAVASNPKQRILVDYARRNLRVKRGGGNANYLWTKYSWLHLIVRTKCSHLASLGLDWKRWMLGRHGSLSSGISVVSRWTRGAKILARSPTTVRREWTSAKAWLLRPGYYGELKERYGDDA